MPNFFNTLFGIPGKSKSGQVSIPDFQVDPYYTKSQDTLSELGGNILSGKLPGFFNDIGQSNSPQFQNFIKNMTGNINQGVANQTALSGTSRSGVSSSASADALGSIIPNLSYQDFLNAQNQKVGLLNTGIGVEQNVNANARSQEGLVNSYNTDKYKAQLGQAEYLDKYSADRNNAVSKMYGDIISGITGAVSGGMGGGGFGGATAGGLSGLFGNTNGLSELFDSIGKGKSSSSSGGAGGNSMLDPMGSFGSESGFAKKISQFLPMIMAAGV